MRTPLDEIRALGDVDGRSWVRRDGGAAVDSVAATVEVCREQDALLTAEEFGVETERVTGA